MSIKHLLLPIFALISLCAAHGAWAVDGEPPAPEDFAYGMQLSVDAAGGLNTLPLPAAVYAALTRSDYGDLRVFNRAGQAVAHTLHTPQGAEPPEVWTPVNGFPLPVSEAPAPGGRRIRIETRADGSIIEIQPAGPSMAPEEKIAHHILDLSGIEEAVDRLKIDLAASHKGLLNLTVETGEDLSHWRTLVPKASVGVLDYLGHRLSRNEVKLPARAGAYLRLTWSPPIEKGTLADAAIRITADKPSLRRERLSLPVVATEEADGRTYLHYQADGHRPIDRVRVELPSAGTLTRFVLSSRPNETAVWRRKHSGIAYHLKQKGVELTSGTIKLPITTDPHWRLELQSDPSLMTRKPNLVIEWRPHRLVFAATDGGPFKLAYGSANVQRANSHLDELLRTLKNEEAVSDLPPAKAGAPFDLGGTQELTVRNDAWKRYLLWGVMVLAVGLIAALALRLYGQVKRESAQRGSAED